MARVVDGVPITEANRFSKFCARYSDLEGWLDSFQASGIPAVIVFTDYGYALYRTGMEDILGDVE
jgi:hypothetical protein